jgi:hypothetical protein
MGSLVAPALLPDAPATTASTNNTAVTRARLTERIVTDDAEIVQFEHCE